MNISEFLPSHHVLQFQNVKSVWSIVLTCEHASNVIPEPWKWGETDKKQQLSVKHWSIDLGAQLFLEDIITSFHNAEDKIKSLTTDNKEGILVAVRAAFSRLIADCNRPEDHPGVFRQECDGVLVDLNKNLTVEEINKRKELFYYPYHNAIEEQVQAHHPKLVLSIHSFNPIYEGKIREMEVGILFDETGIEEGRLVSFISFIVFRNIY